MGTYLLGIDIGTSACKVAVFDQKGRLMASGTGDYRVYYPHPGWAEQDPQDWWNAVCRTLPGVLEEGHIHPRKIAGIGIAGQSWSAVALDHEGGGLCRTPIWMDTRASEICREVNAKIGADRIFDLCGNPLQPSYTTPKILWYQRESPELYGKIRWILQSNSYIAYRLTGHLSQDLSQGYGLHCFDMARGRWDADMAGDMGISTDILPDIYPCHAIVGKVTAQAAKECGLCQGIPVIAGGLDAACGALGTGVLHPGQTQEQGGQAGGMSICMDQPRGDERLILGYHVVPDRWLLQGGTTGGGGVMRWLEKEFGAYERVLAVEQGRKSLDLLNEEANAVAAGSEGLIFLPYMAGERSPIWDPKAKGVFYGLDFSKTRGHLIRAAMEGVAFSLKHNLDVAESLGVKVDVLRAMGGSANSLLWTQIKSDVTGKPVDVPASDTATTLGAALLAGVGVGLYEDFDRAVDQTIEVRRRHLPDPDKRLVYEANYRNYRKLYDQLKDMMREGGDS